MKGIIAIGNQKGGVAKTTTTVHVAAALAAQGRRVLLIDLDANAGCTRSLSVPDTFFGSAEVLMAEEAICDVLLTNDTDLSLPDNLALVCGRRNLERVSGPAVRLAANLVHAIGTVAHEFDYVFLDTAPNVCLPTVAAYQVARWFVLTTTPEALALEGVNDAMADIQAIRKTRNPALELLGVVLSCVDSRTRIAKQTRQHMVDAFPPEAGPFHNAISRSVEVVHAQQLGKTLFETKPQHKVAEQFRSLANEIVDRIAVRSINSRAA